MTEQPTLTNTAPALWVRVMFGTAIFLALAGPDLLGPEAAQWAKAPVWVVAAVYVVMARTQRGSAMLGHPTRLRREELSPRYMSALRWALLSVLVAGAVLAFVPHPQLSVPYLWTGVGATLALALIIFGGRMQQAMLSYARAPHTPTGHFG